MDHSEELKQVASKSRKKSSAGKWREIEMLKEKSRLREELQDINLDFDGDLDDFDF